MNLFLSKNGRSRLIILLISTAVLFIGLSFSFTGNAKKIRLEKDSGSNKDKINLDQNLAGETMTAVKTDKFIQRVTASGQVQPVRRSVITAPFDGYVQKLYIKIGQKVKKGEPLVAVSENLLAREESYPLRAPFAGIITAIDKFEGEYVAKNNRDYFIAYLDDLSSWTITLSIPEVDILKIKKGLATDIRFQAISDQSYKGEIDDIFLSNTDDLDVKKRRWDNAQVLYPIRVRVLNPDDRIKGGMTATIDIITYQKEKALVLPHEFIHHIKDKYFVYDEKKERKEVMVGKQNEELSEIISGVKDGEMVRQIDFLKVAAE